MVIPILSIVIPTRNREKYCVEAIKDILSNDENCFELIIQDNSDSLAIKDFIDNIKDTRLKYFRIVGRINSVLNMDQALSHAIGEYVCMIGDDDTILPNIFSVVKWAKKNNIMAVCPSNNPAFFWDLDASLKGKLITQPVNSHYKWTRPKYRLKALLRGGIIDYQQYALPRVYHGLMHRDVLNSIRTKAGHVIGGLSPDIYLAVSSCFYVDKYVITNFPISIQGACVQSTSVGNPRGKFEEMPHLWNRGEYHWDESIPRYNSSQTIWAETALKAIAENGKNKEYRSLFNKRYFMTVFWVENRDRHDEIAYYLGTCKYVDMISLFQYYYKYCKMILKAIWKRINGGRREYQCKESWTGVITELKDKVIYMS